jgi:hypothetical protein
MRGKTGALSSPKAADLVESAHPVMMITLADGGVYVSDQTAFEVEEGWRISAEKRFVLIRPRL